MSRNDWASFFYKEELERRRGPNFLIHQGVFHLLYKLSFIRFICNTAT